MAIRLPSFSAVLRLAGLCVTAGGCALAVASLWSVWEVQKPATGPAVRRSGWMFMDYGDLLLVAVCALVVVLAAALCVGPRSRRTALRAGGGSLALLAAALAGIALLHAWIGFDLAALDDERSLEQSAGPGFARAATGLVVAMTGMVAVLAGLGARGRRGQPRAAVSEPASEASGGSAA